MSMRLVYATYAVASLWEVYLFLMQRAALEVSRANSIDPKLGRQMLPLWYASVWPTKIARWTLLFLLWEKGGWMAWAAAWGVVAVATTLLPVPYRHFFPLFHHKLWRDMGTEDASNAPKLMIALLSAEGTKVQP
jgi:hypothetical protein